MQDKTETQKEILLKGIPASPGIVKGKVKILNNPNEIHKINTGDILVAPITTPEYSLAILKAAAIITDLGGTLSHPAIISREMGIPAIVGTRNATKILKDNMEIYADGSKGIIFKIKSSK
jgi:pyruvate,water dikinase